ncbi:MAG: hypothetical protein IT405_01120 [Candidatus Yanofskybacteria bacterium]|nr:hypothetical protein [Candidatus Yanofskybacteria bacterium]
MRKPPFTGWRWAKFAFAPAGRAHCESCFGMTRVRWIAIPLRWTTHAPNPNRTMNERWVYLCDYCTWPDGDLLTTVSIDGSLVILRSSRNPSPRIIIVPRTAWLQ